MNIFLWKSSFHQNLFNIPGDCKNLKLFVKLSKVCHFLLKPQANGHLPSSSLKPPRSALVMSSHFSNPSSFWGPYEVIWDQMVTKTCTYQAARHSGARQ